jgi:hypothetical protein
VKREEGIVVNIGRGSGKAPSFNKKEQELTELVYN